LLYLLSFLDRTNVGNAKVAGMSTDLDLVGLKYNIAAAVFFVPYSLAEVPSNIILKLFRPSRWLPTIMVAWGLVMTLMCLVNTYQGLLIARVFLGLTEAGLFSGVTYYISLWYPRADRATRIAIVFSAATMAGAFGGILAYVIEKMEGYVIDPFKRKCLCYRAILIPLLQNRWPSWLAVDFLPGRTW
jgi:MFS family permease